MRSQPLVVVLAFVALIATNASSQTNSPLIVTGNPRSVAEQLKQHGVELTNEGLLKALKNVDGEVRYLAAEKLAEDKVEEAIPSIAEALNVEKMPVTRINIALALAQLGEDKGIVVLKKSCNNQDLPGYLRARATTYLLDLKRDDCLNATLDMLQSAGDPDTQIQALSLLPRFQNASKQQSQKILDAIVKNLADPAPAVRINASIVLARIGDPLGIPYLQTALASEREEVVRLQMEADLKRLQGTANSR